MSLLRIFGVFCFVFSLAFVGCSPQQEDVVNQTDRTKRVKQEIDEKDNTQSMEVDLSNIEP